MTDHDARPIHRSSDCSFSLFLSDQQFRATLGFLVSILECLPHMDLRLQSEIVTITRDVRSAYMLQPTIGSLFHKIDNVAGSIDIHLKDLITIFWLERQRSCAVPYLIGCLKDLLFSGFAQTKIRQRNIAFDDFEGLKLRHTNLTQNGFDTVSR